MGSKAIYLGAFELIQVPKSGLFFFILLNLANLKVIWTRSFNDAHIGIFLGELANECTGYSEDNRPRSIMQIYTIVEYVTILKIRIACE